MTKPLRCPVGLHEWHASTDPDTLKRIAECAACGKRKRLTSVGQAPPLDEHDGQSG